MAVKLRLMRMGKKKQPTYRIVAADSHSPRDGRFIEIVGTYAPRAEPSVVNVDNDKAVAWLAKGAQPTETVEAARDLRGLGDVLRTPAEPRPKAAGKPRAKKTTDDRPATKARRSRPPEPAAERGRGRLDERRSSRRSSTPAS